MSEVKKFELTEEQKEMLMTIADINHGPSGAYNFRINGERAEGRSTDTIAITPKENGSGIDIHIKENVENETVYIPVVISESGLVETVYNDFYIGKNADVTIIAGCGIHNCGDELSQHDGVHSFFLEENASVKYVEKHYGAGSGTGERVLNPVTKVFQKPGSYMEMETVQIEGVHSTKRLTSGILEDESTLVVKEKLMTSGDQFAETAFEVELNGNNSSTHLVSRSVAKGNSKQVFISKISGNNLCTGHSECDAIIMDDAIVQAVPEITASHVDASLIHEAAIGKIAGDQIIKLMTLGLTEEEAIEEIVNGFLK